MPSAATGDGRSAIRLLIRMCARTCVLILILAVWGGRSGSRAMRIRTLRSIFIDRHLLEPKVTPLLMLAVNFPFLLGEVQGV